jgi:hypothetical protein
MDLAEQFKKQYKITQLAKQQELYGSKHLQEISNLDKIFFKLKENQTMGICDQECKQEMFFKKLDKGWACVCSCHQSYFIN